MLTSILGAITSGYTAKTILKKLASANPKARPIIENALAYGYPAQRVLKKLLSPASDKTDDLEFYTEYEQMRKREKRKEAQRLAATGTAALTAVGLGAGIMAKGAQQAASAVANVTGGPAASTSLTAPSEEPSAAVKTKPLSAREDLLRRFEAVEGPKEEAQKAFEPVTVEMETPLKETKFETQFPHLPLAVKSLLEKGKTPEEVYENIKNKGILKGVVNAFEQKHNVPYLKRIKEMAGEMVPKGSVVMTPFGAGEVHKEHKDNLFVKVGDTLQKVNKNELEKPPEDAIEAITSYLNIPESERSSNIALVAMNPEDRQALVQFHNGEMYQYADLDPELIQLVIEKKVQPKTAGETIYGVWDPEDKESLGAAFYKYILSNPKYAKPRKGEPANPYYKKLGIGYDYWKKLRKVPKKRHKITTQEEMKRLGEEI
jgi:hypothetical protein